MSPINRQTIGNVLSEKLRAGRLPSDAAEFWLGNGAANLNAAKPKELGKLAASLGMIDPPEPCAELGEAAKFIAALTGSADTPVTFQTFDDSPDKRQHLARILHGTLADQGESLRELNQQGAGIFITVNQTDMQGRKAKNITQIRALFADFDGKDAMKNAEAAAAKLSPSIIVESSPGKRHMYWLVNDVTLGEFDALMPLLIEAVGSDPAAKDAPRVLRLPGFMHNKGEPLPVKLLSADPALRYGKDAILGGFGIDAGVTASAAAKESHSDPFATMPDPFWTAERVREVLGSLDPNISREKWRVVGFALKNQLGVEAAAPLFKEWSRRANRISEKTGHPTFEHFDAGWKDILSGKEAFQIGAMLAMDTDGVVADIRKRASGVADEPVLCKGGAKLNMATFLSKHTLTNQEALKMSKVKFIIPDFIPQGAITAYISPPNGGKTALFTHFACQMADSKLKVLYINSDAAPAQLKGQQELADKHGFNILAPDAKDAGGVQGLMNDLKQMALDNTDMGNDVLIFDTMKKFVDMMSKGALKEFMKLMRKLAMNGATICLLGHSNKYRDKDGGLIFEGTADLIADVDNLLYIYSTVASPGVREATTQIAKSRATFSPRSFRIRFGEFGVAVDELGEVLALLTDELRVMLKAAIKGINNGRRSQESLVDFCTEETLCAKNHARSQLAALCMMDNAPLKRVGGNGGYGSLKGYYFSVSGATEDEEPF